MHLKSLKMGTSLKLTVIPWLWGATLPIKRKALILSRVRRWQMFEKPTRLEAWVLSKEPSDFTIFLMRLTRFLTWVIFVLSGLALLLLVEWLSPQCFVCFPLFVLFVILYWHFFGFW